MSDHEDDVPLGYYLAAGAAAEAYSVYQATGEPEAAGKAAGKYLLYSLPLVAACCLRLPRGGLWLLRSAVDRGRRLRPHDQPRHRVGVLVVGFRRHLAVVPTLDCSPHRTTVATADSELDGALIRGQVLEEAIRASRRAPARRRRGARR
jgi:hypothetical protein